MPTNECVSRSITVDAAPSAVLDLMGDPRCLPRWAPVFAESVRPGSGSGERWVVGAGGAEFEIRVRVSQEAGTVDFLAPDEDRGLFARVVPNGEGSEVLAALFLEPDVAPERRDRERAVLEQELQTVRELCER